MRPALIILEFYVNDIFPVIKFISVKNKQVLNLIGLSIF